MLNGRVKVRLVRIESLRSDHPCRFMLLQGLVGFHERDKRAELVLQEKSINLIDFVSVTADIGQWNYVSLTDN